jgi:hypothetical protein
MLHSALHSHEKPYKTYMKFIDFQSALISAFVGSVITLFLAYVSASSFSALPFPIIAMLTGFVITGIVEGILSKGVTILEPAVGAVLVGIVLFVIVPILPAEGFRDVNSGVLVVVVLNGIILSALGGWVGEKLEGTLDNGFAEESPIDWGWVMCGSALGTTITMLFASSLVTVLGYHLTNHIVAFFGGLFIAGFIIGLRSPGVAIKEAGVAGFIAVVINMDIICVALGMIHVWMILSGVVLGILFTLLGSWVGERVQDAQAAKAAANVPTKSQSRIFFR